MYIKRVVIEGFKSFKDRIVIDSLDPGHNVIVGRNGSGKSNFFYAIQFVFSDEFTFLQPEQRQALLHEGVGQCVLNLFVEIVFDNSDGRLPVESKEVSLRRTIGGKQDQYSINNRNVLRSEVVTILETAGFTRSNPYYIVKQGMINGMASETDSARLKLLREIAGTRVYDERRQESSKILESTRRKIRAAKDTLRDVNQCLDELNLAKEALTAYNLYDKERRALEYTLCEQDQNRLQLALREIQLYKETVVSCKREHENQLEEAHFVVKEAKQNIHLAKIHSVQNENYLKSLNEDQQNLVAEHSRLQYQIQDNVKDVNLDRSALKHAENELIGLKEKIAEANKKHETLTLQFEALDLKALQLESKLVSQEACRKNIHAKLNRGTTFPSKAARNDWIREELQALDTPLTAARARLARADSKLKKDLEHTKNMMLKLSELRKFMNRHNITRGTDAKTIKHLKIATCGHQNSKNVLWKEMESMENGVAKEKEKLRKVERSLNLTVPVGIMKGCASVKTVLKTFAARGGTDAQIVASYHGLLIDNFECADHVKVAVEAYVGNRLFNHIVDTGVAATQILQEMKRQQLSGEVYFFALDVLRNNFEIVSGSVDSIPMIQQLNYDDQIEKVIKFVFKNTLIVRNLEIGSHLLHLKQVDCVTPEGDKALLSGLMSGGFRNPLYSRLTLYSNMKKLTASLLFSENKFLVIKSQLKIFDNKILVASEQMEEILMKNEKVMRNYDKIFAAIPNLEKKICLLHASMTKLQAVCDRDRAYLTAGGALKEAFQSELNEELMEKLSASDQLLLKTLNEKILHLTKKSKEVFMEKSPLEVEINNLKNLMFKKINPRITELEISIFKKNVSIARLEMEGEELQFDILQKVKIIEEISTKIKIAEEKVEKDLDEEKNLNSVWLEKFEDEIAAKDLVFQGSINLEYAVTKANDLMQELRNTTIRLEKLGPMPHEDMLSKFANINSIILLKKLEDVYTSMKSFHCLNSKAFIQYDSCMDLKRGYEKDYKSLLECQDHITLLMDRLEVKKQDAIEFTFKQVSKFFKEIFEKMVPKGKACLVMNRKGPEESRSPTLQDSSVDTFDGVGIEVCFSGDQMGNMGVLSGGQKTLVALALIFAIQKCDPGPFYLFDEIDQALDANHRMAVAEVIHDLSKDTQFITTTFRPEFLKHANKCFGVSYHENKSHIQSIDNEKALDFVESS